MTIYYVFAISDSTIGSGNPFVAGLMPVLSSLKTTGASPADVSSHAAITAVGGGLYQIAYDAETYGEAAGMIDCTSTILTNSDRYLPIGLARDSTRIQTGFNADGQTTLSAFGFSVMVGTNNDKTGYSLGGNALASVATGTVVSGSTGSAVILSGLPAGKSFVGQHLGQLSSGEFRQIASQSYASGNYTLNFTGTVGTETGPFSAVTTGDSMVPIA